MNLLYDDCGLCNGTGEAFTQPYITWANKYSEAHQAMSENTEIPAYAVSHANSVAGPPPKTQTRKCSRCSGTGFVPTEAGQQILDLLKKVSWISALELRQKLNEAMEADGNERCKTGR